MDIDLGMAAGYDRMITIFSPEGRLIQVEYAKQAARSGSTAIGLTTKDGIVIVADKKIYSKLIVNESVEKILIIDDHIISSFSGFIPDGRILLDEAREIAQRYKIVYGKNIELPLLVKEIGDIMEMYTRYSGVRPFGVSLIIGGYDDTQPKLYALDPSGIYYQYKAVVIGEGEEKITKSLEEKYDENISLEDGIKLGIDLLKEFLGSNFSIDRIVVGYIKVGEKSNIIEGKEIEKFL